MHSHAPVCSVATFPLSITTSVGYLSLCSISAWPQETPTHDIHTCRHYIIMHVRISLFMYKGGNWCIHIHIKLMYVVIEECRCTAYTHAIKGCGLDSLGHIPDHQASADVITHTRTCVATIG